MLSSTKLAKPPVQADLFDLDSPLYGDVRGEQSIMTYPFFELSKIPRQQLLSCKFGNVAIEVRASAKGMATIYDKEILLYIGSLLAMKIEEGEAVGPDVSFTAHDLFRVTGISSSVRSYERLTGSLERLQGTQIKTNIEAGGEGEDGWFSWILQVNTQYRTDKRTGEKRLKAIRVRLCDWLYRAICKDRRILTYHRAYFDLAPVERRLYELARANVDRDEPYEVPVDLLKELVGSQDALRSFRHSIRKIAKADNLPEYAMEVVETVESVPTGSRNRTRKQARMSVVFTRRTKPNRLSEVA